MTLGLKRCQDFFKEFVILEKNTLLFYEARMNNFPNFLMPKMTCKQFMNNTNIVCSESISTQYASARLFYSTPVRRSTVHC